MAIARLPAHVLVEHLKNNQPRMALDVLGRFGFDDQGAMIVNLARYGRWDPSWAPTLAAAWACSKKSQVHVVTGLMTLMARRGDWNVMSPFANWLLERIDPKELARRQPVHHAAFHGQVEAMPAVLKRLTGTDDPLAFDWIQPLNRHADTPLSLALESADIDTITAVRIWGGIATEQIRTTTPPVRTLSVDVYAAQRTKKIEETTRVWTVGRDRAALLSQSGIIGWADLFQQMGITASNGPAVPDSSGHEARPARRM
jgi:hypothetical protein